MIHYHHTDHCGQICSLIRKAHSIDKHRTNVDIRFSAKEQAYRNKHLQAYIDKTGENSYFCIMKNKKSKNI